MAAIKLGRPGTQYGPCEGECKHQDCATTRKEAATTCALCPEPIGYDRYFFTDPKGRGLVHEECLHREDDAEQEAAQQGSLLH
jgi:hypothetical protein